MAKKTPAATDNAQDSAQKQSEAEIAPQAESAPQAGSTLPFAQKREELIKKFRANAVPREADYKQLLDQHYDVAGALGMANSEDNNGGNTGKGLVFESEKLHVKANPTGGLLSDTNGVSLVTGSSLVIGTDNKVNVKISGSNGLEIKTNGEVGVKLYSNNVEHTHRYVSVISNQGSGVFVHVGENGDKKGLKQYQGSSAYGAVLGVSHDDTLRISTSLGILGVRTDPAGALVLSSSGLKINTIGTSGLKLDSNALKIDTGSSLVIGTDNKVNVKISGSNGLEIKTDGEVGVKLFSNDKNSDDYAAAVIAHHPNFKTGLWINVGTAGDKKGLKQYKSTSGYSAVLGVSHDSTLTINSSSGVLGVNTSSLPVRSASVPLSLSGGNLTLKYDGSLTVSSGNLSINTNSIPMRSASVPLSLSGGNLTLKYDGSLTVSSGNLSINTNSIPMRSASSPLSVSGGNLTLKVDDSLTVSGSTLGVSAGNILPKGTIVMFYGTTIPKGWAICDGKITNGFQTPNLVGRFIRAGGTDNVGSTGGADSKRFTPTGLVTVNKHQLTIDEMPSHTHEAYYYYGDTEGNYGNFTFHRFSRTRFQSKIIVDNVGGNVAHNHGASFQGTSSEISTLPSYYTLVFIVKT